jgi:predicted nucleotidyltransferase
MVRVLHDKRQLIAQACQRFGVSWMNVFGSALRDDFRPGDSDIDLLVEFSPMSSYQLVDACFGLLDELRSILEDQVDLVMVDAVKNRFIPADIERTKQVLCAA